MKISSLDVRKDFLDKKACLNEARRILREGIISGMSEKQLASEIYFHALAFFFCEKTGLFRGMKEHAHLIDLDDGGDILRRRIIYAAAWKIPTNIRKRHTRKWR